VDMTYRLPLLGETGTVSRLFSNAVYAVTNGAFSDQIEPYGVRAYVIGQQMTDAGRRTPDARGQNEKNMDRSTVHGPQSTALVAIAVTTTGHLEQVRAEEPGLPRTGRPGKKNILPNPSFEESTLPGWPHYYVQFDFGPVLIGHPGASFQVVTNAPFHGRFCLQLVSTNNQGKGFFFYLGPQVYQPQECAWSLYLRANRDGVKVKIGGKPIGGFWPDQQVTLTTAWQRYTVTAIVPPGVPEYNKFSVFVLGEGTVWVDAMQLEKGAVPTDFEP